jgi:hypothetical protein
MWHNPLVWVVAALAVYAVAVNVHWAFGPAGARRYAPVARIAYLAGLPALALALRIMDPASLGLVLPRSPLAALLATIIALVVGFSVVGARRWYGATAGEGPPPRTRPAGPEVAEIALGALLLECHWAFVRAGALAATGPDPARAASVAIVLLALEAWSDPGRRTAFRSARTAHGQTRGAALALMSAAVFAACASSVLAWLYHVPVALGWRFALGDPGRDVLVEPGVTPRRS